MFLHEHKQYRFYLSMHIKKTRVEKGLTAEEMALRLGLPLPVYRKLESGRVRLTEELVEQVSSALQLSKDDIFEISRIASVAYVNSIAKALSPNYPA